MAERPHGNAGYSVLKEIVKLPRSKRKAGPNAAAVKALLPLHDKILVGLQGRGKKRGRNAGSFGTWVARRDRPFSSLEVGHVNQ